jgi:glutamate synthase domain-containing protein 3
VLDENGDFSSKANKEMVFLEQLEEAFEMNELRTMIQHHATFTGSEVAHRVLNHWDEYVWKFVKVIPKDYKRMFNAIEKVKRSGLSQQEAVMVAFEENMKDVSRVGGN